MPNIDLDIVRSDLELAKLTEENYEYASISKIVVAGTVALRYAEYVRGNLTVTVDNTLSSSNTVTSSTRTITTS